MILVIDSGGTKLDWRSIGKEGAISQGRTEGFHPLFNGSKELQSIAENIREALVGRPSKVFYYGAGSLAKEESQLIVRTLELVFETTYIEVNSDLLAVARSLCHQNKGVSCILGTGSNSCYYDGKSIVKNIQPLGYILGDEGSGSALGKRLVNHYCRGILPEDLSKAFSKRYKLEVSDILRNVYQENSPNQFLASFAKFLFHHHQTPYVHNLVRSSFGEFVENVLMRYENIEDYPIHFSGSIAFYFNGILREVLNEYQLTVGNIVESPIAGLALYHQEDLST